MEVLQAVSSFADPHLREKFNKAASIVQRTIDLFGAQGVALSFNGGKDSTVLLHITRAALMLWEQQHGQALQPAEDHGLGGIHSFIFERPDDFPEIVRFTQQADERYRLRMEVMRSTFKEGLAGLLQRSQIRAVILGTRRGDPNAEGQETFCPSSADWPPFMRVNPILTWSYGDVWAFLRGAGLDYCPLYDRGYTSIGAIPNTIPNSCLKREDGTFAPAHVLADGRLERAGRVVRSASTDQAAARPGLTLTACIIIVGDEILAAKVTDVNSRFLCQELRAIGWRVAKVVVLPDEVGAISTEVRAAAKAFNVVITAGGLGPTFDDVTMAGIADALDRPLARDATVEAGLRSYFGTDITNAHLKMAEAPQGEVQLVDTARQDGSPSPFPLMRCRNIYVLPGVPDLLRQKWQAIRGQLLQQTALEPFRSITLRLSSDDETQIAPALEHVASQMQGQVLLGSYPITRQRDGSGIVLSLESKDAGRLGTARQLLLQHMPPDIRVLSEQQDTSSFSRSQSTARLSLELQRPASPAPAQLPPARP